MHKEEEGTDTKGSMVRDNQEDKSGETSQNETERMKDLATFRKGGRQFKDSVEAEYNDAINSVIETLKKERKEQGFSQQDIADATGMKAPNITRIETGRSRPSIEILMRYAAALGYDVDIRLKKNSDNNK